MGKVQYAPGIEYVSGSLAKAKKVNGHSHGEYLIGTHRVAPTQNPKCTNLYIRKADSFSDGMAMTEDAINARQRFAAVRQLVYNRERDLTKLVDDQAAFLAQKDSATGKKTMKAYYWKIMGDAYDADPTIVNQPGN